MLTRRGVLAGAAAGLVPGRIDLTGWKLQLPGPREVRDPAGYADRFFGVDERGRLRFWVDAALPGPTPHAHYVRSELRHLRQWSHREGRRVLTARLSLDARVIPAQVTFLQIHGITAGGEDAPPLLRVALLDGAPVAWVQRTAEGGHAERIALGPAPGREAFGCRVTVEGGVLSIAWNGGEAVRRELGFWPFENYFKAGLYPQARLGTATAWFEALSAAV